MAAKKTHRPLPKYMTATARAYKYQRRVPVAVQEFAGRKMWDLSLGSDLLNAARRCAELTDYHDRLIAILSDKEAREEAIMKAASVVPANIARETMESAPDLMHVSWRETEMVLQNASALTPALEREALAIFSFQAFGDTAHIDQMENPSALLTEALTFPVDTPPAPGDTLNTAIFNAMKSAVAARLSELSGATNKHGLRTLRDDYAALRGLAAHTKRGYLTKTESLIKFAGADLPLKEYTPEILRGWRDSLTAEGMSPRSVAAYFHAVKTIMKWALKDDLVPGFAALPTDKVTLPRADDSIESIRWVRFDDDEIKRVWALLKDGWGPGSRFSETRCDSFKMIFRVLLYTGLRPVEVFRLRPEDVTKDLVHASKVKTKIPRTIPLSKHIADFHTFMQRTPFPFAEFGKPESGAETMSESFSKIIRAGGFTNDRHVLYSTKDTLVDRLQRAGASDDVIRGFTGHVSGQGKLRHYKTRLNDSPEGLLILRNAIDAIEYF